jgi:FkbH-like protein
MRLVWSPFDEIGLARIVQLINKTNQFNLTTRRYNEDDVRAMMADPDVVTLQLRLLDRFGDNGMIAILIARKEGIDAVIDTWLMSCRVLGRQVEQASLALLMQEIRHLNAERVVGVYRPTAKNGMVAGHYEKLGFAQIGVADDAGACIYARGISGYVQPELPMVMERAADTMSTQAGKTELMGA